VRHVVYQWGVWLRDRRVVVEVLQKRDFPFRKRPALLSSDRDGTDAPSFPKHRGEDGGPCADESRAPARALRDARVFGIRIVHDLPAAYAERRPERRVVEPEAVSHQLHELLARRSKVRSGSDKSVLAYDVYGDDCSCE